MTFRVGQKVVCVDDSRPVVGWAKQWLRKGNIYEIRSIEPDGDIHLIEIARESGTPFYHSRFRPIVERKTDISIFTAMLKPQGVDA